VPEIWRKLRLALGVEGDPEGDKTVLRLLGVDCRMVTTRYVGRKARVLPDGTCIDAWGTHRRSVSNEFGAYDEYASHPLAEAETVGDVLAWDWASPDDWDVSGVGEQCARLNAGLRHHLRYEVGGIFEWSWALRGFERFLLDLSETPDVACAIMDRFTTSISRTRGALSKRRVGSWTWSTPMTTWAFSAACSCRPACGASTSCPATSG